MRLHFRSVFISDLHLGTQDVQSDCLLEFIRNVECENLYLIGNIVDGWLIWEIDAIFCGHIQHAEIQVIYEIEYLNCDDWVESCTALM